MNTNTMACAEKETISPVTVKFFASLREELGKNQISVKLEEQLTTAQIWEQVCQGKPLPPQLMVAINMEYVDLHTLVKPGDEVAFFPPVTGG